MDYLKTLTGAVVKFTKKQLIMVRKGKEYPTPKQK